MTKADPTPTPFSPYHHGDLPRVLLDSATALVAETGHWDFSLREVARRAGVSHNAPYRHFPDRDALMAAVAVAGFDTLRAQSLAAATDAVTSVDRLTRLGRAYVAFGAANPALYRLMFAQARPRTEALPQAILRMVGVTEGAVRDVIVAGGRDGSFAVDPDDADQVTAAAVAAWSLVHGLASLAIDQIAQREIGKDALSGLIERAISLFVTGLHAGAGNR